MIEDDQAEQLKMFDEVPIVEPKPLTPVMRRLLDRAAAPRDEHELVFMHSVLCQVGLPRRDTQTRIFERKSGNRRLFVEAGWLWDGKDRVEYGLPYGPTPRLILAYICREALRNGPVIELGDSTHDFMKQLGLDTNSRGYKMTREQMNRLAACRMTLATGDEDDGFARTTDLKPFKDFIAWTANKSEGARSFWPAGIKLSAEMYETLISHPVPLEKKDLAALKHSALALDIYTFLAERLWRITGSNGVRIPWVSLKEQFGQEYKELKDFKREFKNALLQVKATYQDARIEEVTGGLRLYKSRPPIPRKLYAVGELPTKIIETAKRPASPPAKKFPAVEAFLKRRSEPK